ncbi:HD domain-containing protein [Anoxybacillus rupiensis]|uniref:HD domain-containing protein n=1 Tax=Anoxybacteroides rupiense TaxID=311460 RepID=A0ABT5W3N8_9BACL|nr:MULTISPECIES: HD domain-containing protein [Anoxybacillus]MBS2771391.1 HD domain-containing protein [Anoxybacillus rupiensis]MDE8563927.1 HD domain-containing protein [Anoxybacillus rupiensis]QHC05601.1 HD domain-containing protein [Anoxybacillus sp. PDR2]
MSYPGGQLSEEKVFKDPVHRYIHVRDKIIWDLIGTKEFQRLRRIKQLGTTYLTFHGAEHSRFNHSLGVYEIIRRIIDDVFVGREHWDHSERLLCLCAALLHDLGHGPFSHSFEKVFHLDHEDFTQAIILGDTEVHAVLKRMGDDFPQKVAEVIAKTYQNKLVVSLISSQIDADRMDYLLRDAYYTGVSYGNFDMERILRVMRPREDQVVIKRSGMHAVEDYIMSRYQMYWQVYFHPVTRSAEVILTKILHRAKTLHEEGYMFRTHPHHFYSLFTGQVMLRDYLKLDEAVILYYFQQWQDEKDEILRDLCRRFVHRRLFKYVEFSPTNEQMKKLMELTALFKKAGIDPDYYLVVDSSSDLPYDFYRPGEEGERLPIYLLMPNGELRELSRESVLVDAISGKRRTDHKLYFPDDFLQDFSTKRTTKKKILEILEG